MVTEGTYAGLVFFGPEAYQNASKSNTPPPASYAYSSRPCVQEYILCCSNLRNNLQNLKMVEAEREKISIAKKRVIVAEALKAKMKPFREPTEKREFLAQLSEMRDRYIMLHLCCSCAGSVQSTSWRGCLISLMLSYVARKPDPPCSRPGCRRC